MKFRILATALLLLITACSGSSADDTTSTTAATTTSEAPTTTVAETTTTEPPTTTSEATTTTEPEGTTTTSTGDATSTTEGDVTTTSEGTVDTTSTTYPPPPSTTSTTLAPGTIKSDLEPWAGLFKQPAGFPGFLEFRADGVVRAGTSYTDLPFEGTWDYDSASDSFIFSNFDVGDTSCGGADGRYAQDKARGGGRTLTVIDDPCNSRVEFLTLPGSTCQCMTWLRVVDEP